MTFSAVVLFFFRTSSSQAVRSQKEVFMRLRHLNTCMSSLLISVPLFYCNYNTQYSFCNRETEIKSELVFILLSLGLVIDGI